MYAREIIYHGKGEGERLPSVNYAAGEGEKGDSIKT